ncbi:MAG: Anaerobic sulfatase-maturating enzyme [Verrucomicrobiae bacterium]|nr:Anaerobic sulfatase-maturating enzyme [Verrucomicrobiae bacterium]
MSAPLQDAWSAARVAVLDPDGTRRAVDKYDAPALAANSGPVNFHVMAKPVGSICNIDCTYCFYLHKEHLPGGPGAARMSDETQETFIRQYMAGVTGPEVTFTWQGGEPMLRGLDFYRRAVALQKKYARPKQTVNNDLQTNGTLLDEEWCAFLKEHKFLVGLSIDGPREIHDQYRVDKGGQPTFHRVMHGLALLKKFGIRFNTLTCVNRHNARKPVDIYKFLRDEIGSTYMQFAPIVEYRAFKQRSVQAQNQAQPAPRECDPESRPGHPNSIVTDWSVDPEDWGYFLCRLFDRWVQRDVGKIYVNQFETLIAQHLGEPSQMCVYSENCGKAVAVEHDGSLYSCDHFVYPDYRIGHLADGNLRQTVLARDQVKFGYAKSEMLPQYCRQCSFLSDCWGECPKNRILRTATGEPGLNYLCRGLKTFYAHALPQIDRIVAGLRANKTKGARP